MLTAHIARQTALIAREPVHIAHQARALSGLINKESHVAADQKLFTTVKRPTYIKRDSDRWLFTGMLLGLGFGFVQCFRGEISMVTGTGKKE